MLTIKTGKLFVEKYNEENRTNLSPKEVFVMLAEKAFYGPRHMMSWKNSKFFQYLKDYNNFIKGERNEPSFQEALDGFCDFVENKNYGVETSLSVFGGCAVPNHLKMQTTEFNYCDNLHFTVDERYYSFIGAFFQIGVGQFTTVIENKTVIWKMFESFNKYHQFIHDNEVIADKQLPTWNGCYLHSVFSDETDDVYHIAEKRLIEEKNGENKLSTINFLEFLDAVSQIKGLEIHNITFNSLGQTNTSAGTITIELKSINGWFDIFRQIVKKMDEDFNIIKYAKCFDKKSLIYKTLEAGEITTDMIDPLSDLKDKITDKTKKQFLKEYFDLLMKQEEIEMAKAFGAFIKDVCSTKQNNKQISFSTERNNVFNARKQEKLGEAVCELCEKANVSYKDGIPYDVVMYFSEDAHMPILREFLMCAKYNS